MELLFKKLDFIQKLQTFCAFGAVLKQKSVFDSVESTTRKEQTYSEKENSAPLSQSGLLLNGQSLFEVVFAIAIVGLLLTGIVSLSASSLRNTDFSRNQTIATKYANEGMEWIRIYRDTNWDDFKTLAGPTAQNWCLNSLNPPSTSSCGTGRIGSTIFWREITLVDDLIADPNGNTVDVEIRVYWDDSSGSHVVNTTTSFTRWEI